MPPDTNKDGLDTTIPAPLRQYIELRRIDLAIGVRYKGKVYTGEEMDGGWVLRIAFTTMDLQTVDAVLVNSLGRGVV